MKRPSYMDRQHGETQHFEGLSHYLMTFLQVSDDIPIYSNPNQLLGFSLHNGVVTCNHVNHYRYIDRGVTGAESPRKGYQHSIKMAGVSVNVMMTAIPVQNTLKLSAAPMKIHTDKTPPYQEVQNKTKYQAHKIELFVDMFNSCLS